MNTSAHLAKHVRGAYFGPNTAGPNLRDQLADVTFEQATTKVGDLNTILALTYHMHYYIRGLTEVLEGGELTIRDKFSYDHPPIETAAAWEEMKQRTYREAERFAELIDAFPATDLNQPFFKEAYGNYFDNLVGTVHHFYYHLGQIGLLKKLV